MRRRYNYKKSREVEVQIKTKRDRRREKNFERKNRGRALKFGEMMKDICTPRERSPTWDTAINPEEWRNFMEKREQRRRIVWIREGGCGDWIGSAA